MKPQRPGFPPEFLMDLAALVRRLPPRAPGDIARRPAFVAQRAGRAAGSGEPPARPRPASPTSQAEQIAQHMNTTLYLSKIEA
jgi:hypothetical protein